MRPDISEFSYGYAVTDELIHWHGTTVTASPFFPSLYREGRAGGGYDVMLQRPGLPLFLQFKLSDCMVTNRAREARLGLLTTPYYRMHLRPARHSLQHEMLLDLENNGQEVYYSAPAFHRSEELNDVYLAHEVRNRSIWVRPSFIGQLPDQYDHYLAFQIPGPVISCSEPRKIEAKAHFEEFSSRVEATFRQRGKLALREEQLVELASKLADISQRRVGIPLDRRRMVQAKIEDRHPVEQIAFYSQVFLGCRFFILRHREEAI